ncbi:UDP-N-acetylmuramate dehydrogenase [Geobacter anodireducens]|uniref:UDP-N-acetylenolpyruvoylglucosamine reductase n=1 Tax=Geobacter soli TaxID=1510391 RepID=A0A0C1QYX9_9BACT|nr:UDP-N-acetylmuramate dehydrogenase [Geobacter soli]ANA41247.1 UDP-N-acetylenolpyruvoylglucosamine reductase [Geobacter anodireducens]KIE43396.1 UDP-N-acetylenolpyruvoylglucosamine reductase [Geobacter soli]HMN01786.1 UDP-N-acetylmuramate dehydrogenase [Geobacter anodireducens]
MNDRLAARLEAEVRGEILRDEPMARHTSLKVGGPADFFVTPADPDDMRVLLALLAETGTPWLAVGGGYNLLIRDGGFRGVVISPARMTTLERLEGNRAGVGAGVANGRLTVFLRDEGLAGLEFLCGIPGTVGGALAMNAGAHGNAILDRVEEILTIGTAGFERKVRELFDYGYRYLRLQPGEIIIGATFVLDPADPRRIGERIDGYRAHRAASQQVGFPNAGSFFKNPPGQAAWRLIEDAGLRGARVGGAQVSEVHANFLVNRGGATAADFLALAARIKEAVKLKSGTALEEEVNIFGDE